MLLIPIRHGETEWNTERREMGHLDSPLTARGVRQAEAIARRLSLVSVQSLYTSDLGRAVQTAEIIGAATGMPIRLEPGLRERDMGAFQGLTPDEITERFPKQIAEYRRVRFHAEVPGGESAKERSERSVRVLTEIASQHTDQTIVVVTHGGFLTGFLEFVLGLAPGNSWRFKKQNASFNAFEFGQGKWTLGTWNDVEHLEGIDAYSDPTAG